MKYIVDEAGGLEPNTVRKYGRWYLYRMENDDSWITNKYLHKDGTWHPIFGAENFHKTRRSALKLLAKTLKDPVLLDALSDGVSDEVCMKILEDIRTETEVSEE